MNQVSHAGQILRICALSVCVALVACGKDDPAAMTSRAKAAIEKREFSTADIELKNALQADPQNAEARFLFGTLLLEQGDAVGAEPELRKALEQGYSTDAVTPALARALVELRQADKAIAQFGSTQLGTAEANARLQTVLGEAYLAGRDRAKAATAFAAALAASPRLPEAILGTAKLKYLEGDAAGAQATVDSVLAENAKHFEALLLKAEILSAQKNIPDAIAAFQQARSVRPSDLRPYERIITLHLASNQQKEAEETLAALKKMSPNHPQTAYLEAVVALRVDRFVDARDSAAKVLRVAPDYSPALVVGAVANMRLGDHLQAQTMLQRAIVNSPQWASPRKLLAESYIAQRSPDDALQAIALLANKDTPDPEVLNIAGQAYFLKNDYVRATENFSRLANLRPDNASARVSLGLSRMAGGDETRAMDDLEAATRLDSNRIQAELALIAAHLRKGETAKALQAVDALESKQPTNPLTYNVKGQALLAAKDIKGARTAFEKSVALQPGNLAAAVQLARLDIADKKPEEAKKHFQAIIDKEPKNVRAYVLLAQLEAETGAPSKRVQEVLEKAINAEPTRNDARIILIRLHLASRDNKAALNLAQQAAAAQPDSVEVLEVLGRTQRAVGENQQAVSTFTKLQAIQPQNPAGWIELADAQQQLGEARSAEQSLKRALSLKPDLIEAQQRLASLYVNDNRAADAMKIASEVQQQRPKSPAGFVIESEVHAKDKKWDEANDALQKAFALSKTPQLLTRLHAIALAQGKEAEARKMAQDWIRSNPKDGLVRAYLADLALKEKKYPEAAEHYKAVLKVQPNAVIALNNLAWIAYLQNDPKVLEYAEAALKAAPASPAVMETAGSVFVSRGQTQRGLELLKKAAEQAPQSPEIKLGYAKGLATAGDKSAARREITAAAELAKNRPELKAEIDAFAKTL